MDLPPFSIFSLKIQNPLKSLQNLKTHLTKLLKDSSSSFNNESTDSYHPSPLMVPLPILISSSGSKSTFKNLVPSMDFAKFLEKKGTQMEEKCIECSICLSEMEKSNEIRELVNCCHVFHCDCLDKWVSKGKMSCPLCRADLVPNFDQEGGGDPWRVQRILYLFGEDFVDCEF